MKAAIFDMDGTLVNSERFWRAVMKKIFSDLKMDVSHEEYLSLVGVPMHDNWVKMKKKHNLDFPVEELMDINRKTYYEQVEKSGGLSPMPGIVDLLSELRDEGVAMGVATSAPRDVMHHVLDELVLKPFFGGLSSADDVVNGKPAPDIFLRTAGLLGAGAQDCVVFEDAYSGITGAKAAGMKCVAYSNGGRNTQDMSGADFVVDSYGQLKLDEIRSLF